VDIQVARFREVLDLLKPAVARKSAIKSLGYVMIKDGQAVATDLETMVIHSVPEADLTALVPLTDVTKFLQFTPGGEMLNVKGKRGKLSLSWANGSASFPMEDPENFPAVPEFVPEVEESLDIDALISAMAMVQPYAATDATRPVLNAVTLILGNPVEVAAGDGYRMADQVIPLQYPKEITVVIPNHSVTVLEHLLKKTPRTPPASDELIPVIMAKKLADVAHDGKQGLRFRFNKHTAAIVKSLEGKPPDWLKLIPKGDPILRVQLLASELELAVRRIMGVAKAGKEMARIAFEDKKAIVSAKEEGQESQTSFKTYESEGEPNKIALNAAYLLEYLSGKQGLVTISWTGNAAPVAFLSRNDPRVLIMPMNEKD